MKSDDQINDHRINFRMIKLNIFKPLCSAIIMLSADAEFNFSYKRMFDYIFTKRRHAKCFQNITYSRIYQCINDNSLSE